MNDCMGDAFYRRIKQTILGAGLKCIQVMKKHVYKHKLNRTGSVFTNYSSECS